VPYEIITSEIWDYVMPHWMEAMVNDVPEKEQHELKNLLRSAITFSPNPCIIIFHPYVTACVQPSGIHKVEEHSVFPYLVD
jgi:hypothetical protein